MPRARVIQRKSSRRPVDPHVREQRRFARAIKTMFEYMGFSYLRTEGKEAKFGIRAGELDAVFVYENVILVVEDTTSSKAFDHAKHKRLLAEQILASQKDLVEWLREEFPEHRETLSAYAPRRFKLFYLYISQKEMDLDDDELALLAPMKVVTTRALSYFDRLSKTIRRSARTDLWRFLELEANEIGASAASKDAKTIETTIISPDDSTGFTNGVRLVSFMISADVLLRNSYVLRKDNWGYSTDLYQRLIDTSRIKKIRQYVASDNSAFLNNIIIGLPPNVAFQDDQGAPIGIDDIQDYSSYRMTIPDEFNSLCVIDGQHRVFAHYEGTDDLEPKVAAVRGKVHLLATGLLFPRDMNELERMKLQSEIFLDINSNSKPVPADVLLAIQSLRAPYADVAIARRVLEAMNKKPAFRGMLQLSQMDQAPIRIASIVKFALRYLVDIEAEGGLFSEWCKLDPSRDELRNKNSPTLLNEYVQFCATTLDIYFKALKDSHFAEWGDTESKVTSTTVINGMIIALRRSLPALGLLSFSEYSNLVEKWDIDFSKESFGFTSSQYARFSLDVLRNMFNLSESEGRWTKTQ